MPAAIAITLPDHSVRSFPAPLTGLALAETLAKSLAKKAVAVIVNGVERDLSYVIATDASVSILTREQPAALELLRHDAAHVMAEAVKELYPDTQVTIGPAIENGFYYDFYRATPFTPDDLPKIEARMREIVARDEVITREEWHRDAAMAFFKGQGEHFKAEIIADIPADQTISLYRQGQFIDLCRGPHLPSTGRLGTAFRLTKISGSYWRGDAKGPQLQRIYGTAWATEAQLDAYLKQLEEAEKRDHRRLGQQMGLFHFQSEAQGSVFWHPKGFTIFNTLERYIRARLQGAGYVEVKTPQLIDNKLWEQSGHWGKFRENMFVVPDETPNTTEDGPIFSGELKKLMALKPMNCPAHVQIFRQGIKSYRDLPLRMAEFGCCHRNEAHGALHGLMRVRQMTQDDAHIFCRPDQIEAESIAFCRLLESVYTDLGFSGIKVKLALRPDVRAGSDATWDLAEGGLRQALEAAGLVYEDAPGEGAFYGPKLEFHLTDAIGRSWQCGTLQLDFVLPERLDASYVGEDGEKHRPVMLHRAILGTLERFIGILLEHYAGNLPLWLAPVQAVVATITSDADGYAVEVLAALQAAGVRAEADLRNEKINYKVREHSVAKVPYLLVVGRKEAEQQTVAVRQLGQVEQPVLPLAGLVVQLATAGRIPV
jgi:threonyl-tRNA synthetase